MYIKAFLPCVIEVWERTSKKARRDGETGKHTLNEMGALNMKKKRWNKQEKSKRYSYSPVVFKDGFSLETHLEVCWKKKKKPSIWAFVAFKKFQNNPDMPLNFKN